jgi:hypothetical protein
MQHNAGASARKLPSGLASGQTTADDVNWINHGDCRSCCLSARDNGHARSFQQTALGDFA